MEIKNIKTGMYQIIHAGKIISDPAEKTEMIISVDISTVIFIVAFRILISFESI